MAKPKVSICVPVYNTEKYIAECLESLVKQTLKEIEIICVDDGSTDDSPEILDEYSRRYKNVKVIHQKNKGLGKTRDEGVKNASGEFIGFVDADDKVDLEMYEKLYNLATKNDAKVAFCNVELFPNNVKTDKKPWYNPFNGYVDGDFLYRNTNPCNKIFHHNLFNMAKMKFEKNDTLCTLLMIYADTKMVSSDEKMYKYRVGHSSMSTSYNINGFVDTTEMLKKVKNEVKASKFMNDDLDEYLSFLIIDSLIKTMTVSVLLNNKKTYIDARDEFKVYNYKGNGYVNKILKREYGRKKFFAMMYVLPKNYFISKFLICNVLGGHVR